MDMPDPVASLAGTAAHQHWAFTSVQAAAAGWSQVAIAAARRTQLWRRLYRGVYVESRVWETLTRRDRHLCLVHGRTLARGPGWHAARRSAATAHGFPLIGAVPTVPQLVRAPTTPTARATSRHERLAALPPEHCVVLGGLALTGPPRTVIDIARGESFRSAVVVADAALRAGTSREELLAMASSCATWPNGVAGRRVADFADGLAESPLESLSRVTMHARHLPAPELQIKVFVGTELVARLDFLWRATNTIGQADGAMKYSGKQDVLADKLQDERLEDLGFEVVRWPWSAAWDQPALLEEKVRRGMLRGARQELDPRVRLVTTTIAENVRANERRRAS